MSDLQTAISAYRAALPPGDLLEFETTPFDHVGVPCRTATFFARDGRVRGGIGYGANAQSALVGALGEMTEEFAASRAVAARSRVLGSYEELARARGHGAVLDPLTLCLHAGSDYSPDMPRQWLQTSRLGTNERVLVPIEFVATYTGDVADDSYAPLITPITNGLGAGLTYEQAVSHGLLELLQRDGNGLNIRALSTRVALDKSSITDSQARAVLNALDKAGVEVEIKIASTDFGMTGFYVVGLDRAEHADSPPVMSLGGGEAVHPVANVALRKALLEFCSSRARMSLFHGPLSRARELAPSGYLERILPGVHPQNEEPRALSSMLRWLNYSLEDVREQLAPVVLNVEKRVAFSDLPTSDEADLHDKSALLQLLTQRLHAEGLEILVADFSAFSPGAHAVKVIVPGLEVETMSYGRIGARNLRRLLAMAENDGPQLAGTGKMPHGALPIALPDSARDTFGPAWLRWSAVQERVEPLYSLYREPGRHAAPLLRTEQS